MLDLKITGGTIVDGTGASGYKGDLGVKDGRIVVLGTISEDARETVDATGRIVAPGFIDVHTHYDAQVFWDPKLSPSCFHGVTTIVGGFCGFSIAPLSKDAAAYLLPMLARVEGMPAETLELAVPWNWESFGEYLDRLEGKVGLNAGFFAGHSAIRRVVMGERAVGATATEEELEKMKALLGKSLAEGALGFSSTVSVTHNDADGNPVPSRWADDHEMVELARVVGLHEGTGIEFLPGVEFNPHVTELITQISIAGNRPVNWNVLAIMGRSDSEEKAISQLAVSDYARKRGGEVIALTVPSPPELYINLRTGFIFDVLPGMWREIFKWPVEERMRRLRGRDLRDQLAADARTIPTTSVMAPAANLAEYRVVSVTAERSKRFEGWTIAEIGRETDRAPIDVMIDIALDDELMTVFAPNIGGHDRASYELRGRLWKDDRTLIGASDAGAHIDMIDTFAFSTIVLEEGVRRHKVISLEEAVNLMTERPARYFGLVDRGVLKPGNHADIVVFDKNSVGRGPTYNRFDVPGDQFRVYADAIGVDHVFVNGVQIVRNGEHSGALPGTVLRSGRDTKTVPLDVLQDKSKPRVEAKSG
jgi:N-acyl-D-aspartate/D-glutamate deacylase